MACAHRGYALVVRKIAVLAAVALAVVGTTLFVLPFNRPQPRGTFTYGSGIGTRCTSPVVGAWRTEHDSGWFGYAPLTSTPPHSFPTCHGASRHRLAWGSVFLIVAVLLGLGLGLRRPGSKEKAAPPTGT